MNKILYMLPMVLSLVACSHEVAPVQTQFTPVQVQVPAPCPVRAVSDALIAARPVPLRNQKKPADASVRSALSQAQLGKYEALGGWADQVIAALTRCQSQ